MWKSIVQLQAAQNPTATVDEDTKFQDLIQENSVLKQELTDLYEHLVIIDNADESATDNTVHSKVSSVGRLIVYDKTKRDTEALMKQEALRQNMVLMEKEISYQTTHIREQASKIRDLETKLKVANDKILSAEVESVSVMPFKQKCQELTAALYSQGSELHAITRQNTELATELSQYARRCQESDSHLASQLESNKLLQARLIAAAAKIVDSQGDYVRLSADHDVAKKQVEDQNIALLKAEVTIMDGQTEVKHWERKAEAQGRELAKLMEAVTSLRTSLGQREAELARERGKICQRCSGISEQEEELSTPLMGGGGANVVRVSSGSSASSSSSGGSNGHKRSASRDRQRGDGTPAKEARSDASHSYKQVSSKDKQQDEEGLFGDDCLCPFFPNMT